MSENPDWKVCQEQAFARNYFQPPHWHSRALCQLSSPGYCAAIKCRCYCHSMWVNLMA